MQALKAAFARGLSGNALKMIAIVCMSADHIAWTVHPGFDRTAWVLVLHGIGRICAPVMWFFVAEGACHTRNIRRYAARLFALAAVSHFAYCFCFGLSFLPFRHGILNQTGVGWTLFLGLLLVCIHRSTALQPRQQSVLTALVCLAALPADWSCAGCMAILFLAGYRGNFRRQCMSLLFCAAIYALAFFLFVDRVYGVLQLGVALSIPLLRLYNGQKGKGRLLQPFFYIYYPAHLFVLGLFR